RSSRSTATVRPPRRRRYSLRSPSISMTAMFVPPSADHEKNVHLTIGSTGPMSHPARMPVGGRETPHNRGCRYAKIHEHELAGRGCGEREKVSPVRRCERPRSMEYRGRGRVEG